MTSSATSRDAVATCSPLRRAISETRSSGSSGVKAAITRTARASDDSPVAALDTTRSCQLSRPLRSCYSGGRSSAEPDDDDEEVG